MFKKIDLQMPNATFRNDVRQVISELPGISVSETDTETLVNVAVFLTEFLVLFPQEYPPKTSNEEVRRISFIHEYQLICLVMDGLYGSGWDREIVLFILSTILVLPLEESVDVLHRHSRSWLCDESMGAIALVREFLSRAYHLTDDPDIQAKGRLKRLKPAAVRIYELGKEHVVEPGICTAKKFTGDTSDFEGKRRDQALKSAKGWMKRGQGSPVDNFAGETADPFFGILDINTIKNKYEYWYLNLLRRLIGSQTKDDRTGTGTYSESFETYKHDLREGFPALRSRFLKPENPGKELKWMLSGSDNEKDLAAMGVPFWSEFADETGNLGPVYGYLWRHWPNGDGTETDQVKYVQELLRTNPTSRRMVVDCWHPTFIPDSKKAPKDNYKEGKQALTPCHILWDVVVQPMSLQERIDWLKARQPNLQLSLFPVDVEGWYEASVDNLDHWNVPKYFLDLGFVMRSTDTVLGLPANMNFYATLAHALAKGNNMVARYLGYVGMDVHVYKNHIEGIEKQFEYVRQNSEKVFGEVTEFSIEGKLDDILDMEPEQFRYQNYSRELVGPAIKFPIAV